jgi:YVTN family beta-propeller protein
MSPSNEIGISSTTSDESLDDEVKQRIDNYDQPYGLDQFVFKNAANTTVSSLPARVLNYSYIDERGNLRNVTEIMIKSNDKVYSIKYSADENDFLGIGLSTFRSLVHSMEIYNLVKLDKIFGNYTAGVLLTLPDEDPWAAKDIDSGTMDLMAHQVADYYGSHNDNLTLSVNQDGRKIDDIIGNETKDMTDVVQKSSIIKTTNGTSVTAYDVMFVNPNQTREEHIYANYNNSNYVFRFSESNVTDYFDRNANHSSTAKAIMNAARIIEFASTKDLKPHINKNVELEINMSFPTDWNVTDDNMFFTAYDNDSTQLQVTIGPQGLSELEDLVADDISSGMTEGYQILESNPVTVAENKAHKVVYMYRADNQQLVKGLTYYIIFGNKIHYFVYEDYIDKFASHQPTIERIIHSISFNEKAKPPSEITRSVQSGLKLNSPPIDLVINPVTNKLYIAASDANMLFVVNATSDTILSNITIDGLPNALAMNPVTNMIYAASPITDKLYVIDGSSDKLVKNISAGPDVKDIAVDPNELKAGIVLVANAGNPGMKNNSVSIIDGLTNTEIERVSMGYSSPSGITVDPVINSAFVTGTSNKSGFVSGSVSKIDYSVLSNQSISAKNAGEVFGYTGLFPTGIAIDPNTGEVYVANSGSQDVTVINGNNNQTVKNIKVGQFPNSLAISNSSKVYVANTGVGFVSVFDPSKPGSNSSQIAVASPPIDISTNQKTNMVYVASPESRTISTIDGNKNMLVATVKFGAVPQDSGSIACGADKITLDTYTKIPLGTICRAVPNHNFIFDSWKTMTQSNFTKGSPVFETVIYSLPFEYHDLKPNQQISSSSLFAKVNEPKTLNVTADGIYSASFVPYTQAFQFISPYISIIVLGIILLITSIPSAFARFTGLSHLRDLKHIAMEKDIDILGVDSAVIAGVLILLTLSGFAGSEQAQLGIITVTIIFPFAISGISMLLGKKEFSVRMMNAGFIYLIITVILVAILMMP